MVKEIRSDSNPFQHVHHEESKRTNHGNAVGMTNQTHHSERPLCRYLSKFGYEIGGRDMC